jgi:hypothetical protein
MYGNHLDTIYVYTHVKLPSMFHTFSEMTKIQYVKLPSMFHTFSEMTKTINVTIVASRAERGALFTSLENKQALPSSEEPTFSLITVITFKLLHNKCWLFFLIIIYWYQLTLPVNVRRCCFLSNF